ncbi:MAG: hypothetical protein EBS72_10740, partial [Rhizobiales bacterium]|nr:hypothetical protein [Hyphomicrobiales bacterium]
MLNISTASGTSVAISLVGTQTYSGVISGGGNVSYLSGSITVSGNNTYTGTTTISGATVLAGYATHYTNGVIDYSPLGSTPVVSLANVAAASLALGANSIELYALSGGGATGGGINLGTGALTVGTGNTNTTYSGVISGSATNPTGSLTKVGTGTLTLNNNGSTYQGLTTINGGTLAVAAAAALGAGNGTPELGNVTVNTGGTLDIQATMTISKPLVLNGGTLQNSGTAGSYSGGISLTANSFINVPNTGLGLTLSGVMSNSGGTFGLTKTGAGKATLSGTSTFGGDININAGSLVLGSAAGLGPITKTITVNSGGSLDVQTTTSNAYPTVMNGGSIGNSSTTASVYSGPLTLQTDTQINIGSTGGLGLSGAISGNYGVTVMGTGTGGAKFFANNSYTGITTISTGSVTLGTASISTGDFGATSQIINNGTIYIYRPSSFTISAPISGTGSINFGSTSATVTLTANNSFTGSITISGASSRVNVAASGSLPNNAVVSFTSLAGMPVLDLSDQTGPITFASLSGTGGVTASLILGVGGLTVAGGTTTFFGQITGTGPLTINGNLTMTQTMAVDNTIPITIGSMGTLKLSGNGWLGNSSKIYTNLLTNNGTFNYGDTSFAQILSGGVTGTGNVINSGLSLTMKGSINYTGTTSITYGSAVFGDSTTTGAASTFPTGNIILSNNGILVLGTTADATFANNVTGVGSLQKYGPSNITLTGTNSFATTGGVSLDNYSGGLIMGNASALPTGLIRFQGGTSAGASVDFNGLTVNNAISLISGANGTSRINVQNSSSTAVTINGNIDITKSLVTYSGLTIGGTGDIVMNGVFTNSSTTNGYGNLIKQGTGTLTINTASTRNGPVDVINAGTVLLNGSGSLFTGTASGLTMTGGSLIFSDKAVVLGGGLNMSGSPTITGNGVSSLSVSASSTLAGTITTSGTQNYASSSTLNGSLTLNTTNANVTTPYMMVPSGQSGNYDLVLNLGTGNFSLNSGSFGVGGSTIVAKTFRMNGSGGVSIAGSGGIFALNDVVINGTFTGPAVTSTNGPVTLTGGISAYVATNTVTITGGSAGAVTVGNVSNVGGLEINSTNANSVMNGTISNSTGNFTYNKVGFTTGTLTFSGNNSSNLPLMLYGGTFKLGSSQFGTGAISELIGSPTLDLNGQTLSNSLSPFGTGVGGIGALINSNTTTTATLNGAVTLGSASTNFGGAGNMIING